MLIHTLSPLGRCIQGSRCLYTHDPTSVAICKDFLQKGVCPAGDYCDLSHDLSPERTPTCLHFLRGRCSNNPCRYAHIGLSPSALVCFDFATFGFCKKGALCSDRHVHECPAYANTGVCNDTKCRLPHPDSAGQIRQQNSNSNSTSTMNTKPAVADNENSGGVTVDSPGQEKDDYDHKSNDDTNFTRPNQNHSTSASERQFLTQQDFVGFQ